MNQETNNPEKKSKSDGAITHDGTTTMQTSSILIKTPSGSHFKFANRLIAHPSNSVIINPTSQLSPQWWVQRLDQSFEKSSPCIVPKTGEITRDTEPAPTASKHPVLGETKKHGTNRMQASPTKTKDIQKAPRPIHTLPHISSESRRSAKTSERTKPRRTTLLDEASRDAQREALERIVKSNSSRNLKTNSNKPTMTELFPKKSQDASPTLPLKLSKEQVTQQIMKPNLSVSTVKSVKPVKDPEPLPLQAEARAATIDKGKMMSSGAPEPSVVNTKGEHINNSKTPLSYEVLPSQKSKPSVPRNTTAKSLKDIKHASATPKPFNLSSPEEAKPSLSLNFTEKDHLKVPSAKSPLKQRNAHSIPHSGAPSKLCGLSGVASVSEAAKIPIEDDLASNSSNEDHIPGPRRKVDDQSLRKSNDASNGSYSATIAKIPERAHSQTYLAPSSPASLKQRNILDRAGGFKPLKAPLTPRTNVPNGSVASTGSVQQKEEYAGNSQKTRIVESRKSSLSTMAENKTRLEKKLSPDPMILDSKLKSSNSAQQNTRKTNTLNRSNRDILRKDKDVIDLRTKVSSNQTTGHGILQSVPQLEKKLNKLPEQGQGLTEGRLTEKKNIKVSSDAVHMKDVEDEDDMSLADLARRAKNTSHASKKRTEQALITKRRVSASISSPAVFASNAEQSTTQSQTRVSVKQILPLVTLIARTVRAHCGSRNINGKSILAHKRTLCELLGSQVNRKGAGSPRDSMDLTKQRIEKEILSHHRPLHVSKKRKIDTHDTVSKTRTEKTREPEDSRTRISRESTQRQSLPSSSKAHVRGKDRRHSPGNDGPSRPPISRSDRKKFVNSFKFWNSCRARGEGCMPDIVSTSEKIRDVCELLLTSKPEELRSFDKDLLKHLLELNIFAPTLKEIWYGVENDFNKIAKSDTLIREKYFEEAKRKLWALENLLMWPEFLVAQAGSSWTRLKRAPPSSYNEKIHFSKTVKCFLKGDEDITEEKQTDVFVMVVRAIKKGLSSDEENVKRPFHEDRQRLAERLKAVVLGTAAFSKESVEWLKSEDAGEDGENPSRQPSTAARERVPHSTRSEAVHVPRREEERIAEEKDVIGSILEEQQAYEDRKTASTSDRKAADSEIEMTDVVPRLQPNGGKNSTKNFVKTAGKTGVTAAMKIGRSRYNNAADVHRMLAESVRPQLTRRPKGKRVGDGVLCAPPVKEEQDDTGMPQSRKAGPPVRFGARLIADEIPSKMDREEVSTLFNDGFDLLSSRNQVQEKAVAERLSQISRGALYGFFGYLRAYIANLQSQNAGRQKDIPFVHVLYPPSVTRKLNDKLCKEPQKINENLT